jgi:hypothetical protein
LSTAYHPQSDGGTERLIRELEQQLRSHANRAGNNWKQWLAIVEMHYNSDRHESTGKTPYEMNGVDWRDQWAVAMASARPRLTNDAAEDLLRDIRTTWEDARQVMIRQRAQQKKFADMRRREERYKVGDQVMLTTNKLAEGKGKLRDRWVGPFTVVEAFDNGVNVRLDLPKQYSKLHPVFHVEKLKRFIPSSMDWPGREQPKRPKPRLVNGKRKYWALRIIDRKEEDVEFTTQVGVGEYEEKEEKAPNVPVPSVSQGRRISPRDHASTRTNNVPVVLPRPAKKPRTRTIKETRRVVFYKIEWEGYGEEDATWKSEEEVIEEGLEWMIRDYEMEIHQQGDELDLGTAFVFSPSLQGGKPQLRRGG